MLTLAPDRERIVLINLCCCLKTCCLLFWMPDIKNTTLSTGLQHSWTSVLRTNVSSNSRCWTGNAKVRNEHWIAISVGLILLETGHWPTWALRLLSFPDHAAKSIADFLHCPPFSIFTYSYKSHAGRQFRVGEASVCQDMSRFPLALSLIVMPTSGLSTWILLCEPDI